MQDVKLLREIETPEFCYLSEVLNWIAFGRVPEASWYDENTDYRFDVELMDLDEPPIPNGDVGFSVNETEFANLPPDPEYAALFSDRETFELEHYDRIIGTLKGLEPPDNKALAEYIQKKEEAENFHAEWAEWDTLFTEYVDQYKSEIYLAARKGQLECFGRKMPLPDWKQSIEMLDKKGVWVDSLPIEKIEAKNWISTNIDWDNCSLNNEKQSFVLIHVNVEQMLALFPPSMLLDRTKLLQAGETYAFSGGVSSIPKPKGGGRGRPSLPWDKFSIEVARLFRDDEMPSKKEAAILHFQNWFMQEYTKKVSRAAIGQKLKPFYDELVRK